MAAALRHGDETLGLFVVGFREPGDRSDAAEIIGRLARPAEAALATSELAAEAAGRVSTGLVERTIGGTVVSDDGIAGEAVGLHEYR